MIKIRAYAAMIYGLFFCISMAFICACNIEYLFDVKRWTLYWFIALAVFGFGWGKLVAYILNDGWSFERMLILRIKRNAPHGLPEEPQLSDIADAIKNWMPALIFVAAWLLERNFGSNISSLVLFALGLGVIAYFAYREQNWRSQIPAWLIFLASVFIPKDQNEQWLQLYGFSAIYTLRLLSLFVAVIGLQSKKPYFLKILFIVWMGQVILFMIFAFCISEGITEMGIKHTSGEALKTSQVYLAFLLSALVFGFPFALKTAFVGTVVMGVLESFIAECLDILKVLAGLIVLAFGASAAMVPQNHTLLIIPVTAALGLYFGDVLDRRVIDKFDALDQAY